MSAQNKQIGGTHYQHIKMQPVDWLTRNAIPFSEGCIIKYALRHAHKNGAEDVRKGIHFIDLRLEMSDYNKQAHARTWAGLSSRAASWYENEQVGNIDNLPAEWDIVISVAAWLETRERKFLHAARALFQEIENRCYADS